MSEQRPHPLPFLATQYYRPPFPERLWWSDDLDRIAASGLDAIQLWVVWGWVEAEPDVYRFDDYDELVNEAERRKLGVVLSTIAEIHPFWIHRIVPGSEMVDHLGRRVVSGPRMEVHHGLTPGGCFDHPGIASRMRSFLQQVARRYRGARNLIAYDAWNENRWNVHASGQVCYCDHSIAAYRSWLRDRYGHLGELNEAWKRRYTSWEDVVPHQAHHRPYTDPMAFCAFLSDRAAAHMRMRFDAIRSEDHEHAITAHGGQPSILDAGIGEVEQPFCRGNDWDHADQLDGYGCSHFPTWQGMDDVAVSVRLEATRSAAGAKVMWVSELQGGSGRDDGMGVTAPVAAADQRRWVVDSLGRGAKAVIFWCWRDEVFGRESSGFGLSGSDGLADERLRSLREISSVLHADRDLLAAYSPEPGRTGVLFEPACVALDWGQNLSGRRAVQNLHGYVQALQRIQVAYEVVESSHLDVLDDLEVLFAPWTVVMGSALEQRLLEWVSNGGRLVCEAECGAFTPEGFYRYPELRPLMQALAITDSGRRVPADQVLEVSWDGRTFGLHTGPVFTPLEAHQSEVLASTGQGTAALRRTVGDGEVVALGTHLGAGYLSEPYEDFERFVAALAAPPGLPQVQAPPTVSWRKGTSGPHQLVFFTNRGPEGDIRIEAPGWTRAREIFTGRRISLEEPFAASIEAGGVAVWVLSRDNHEPQGIEPGGC